MSANGTIEEMMIAPIEVIEEWGCYETEIRMTCGNLESKIAILEAKFTPRCRTENCIYMDENSMPHPMAAQKVDKLILEETEAGRRFLATMRRNHKREMEAAAAASSLAVPSTTRETVEATTTGEKHVTMMAARSFKDKRSSLRATLEHLIVRYLRRLTIDDDNDEYEEPGNHESGARYRRQSLPMVTWSIEPPLDEERVALPPETVEADGFSNSMEITLLTNDTDTNLTQSWEVTTEAVASDSTQKLPGSIRQPEVAESYKFSNPTISGTRNGVDGGADASEMRGHSVENHSANDGGSVGEIVSAVGDNSVDIEHNQSDGVSRGGEDDLNIGGGHGTGGAERSSPLKLNGNANIHKKSGMHGRPRECGSVRKRVSQLDRFELERSMRNGSFREYNIRNALNYRCSGKNHCSFIFSQDHPFAVVWKEGTIRIKYICMDVPYRRSCLVWRGTLLVTVEAYAYVKQRQGSIPSSISLQNLSMISYVLMASIYLTIGAQNAVEAVGTSYQLPAATSCYNTTTAPDYLCPPNLASVRLSHETSCTRYYVCENGKATEMSCAGTPRRYFNPITQSCGRSPKPCQANLRSLGTQVNQAVRKYRDNFPKRNFEQNYCFTLFALGCEVPPTPGHMRLVRRTEHRAKYVCDPLHVFPDTGESTRELICTVRHTWNRVLPACIEKRTTEGSGLVSHYEQKRKFGYVDSMSDKQADTVYDILIPSFVIAGLFLVNGIVFAVIMRYRNKRKQRLDLESKELAEL
ncbi:uncharacterized protein LOC131207658 [Anopheles bellator]|uniref:uncharacterized protein LOC131207658 n=1 Tax=Anopheles bellator TaxID=139047 RepID=UPI002649DC7A|nr:uncharacterized protein LOC131207658 [Anopheles bellator]